ncbi:cation:proton antiporter [Tessaracoccus flavus]|uniref:Sodium:proton antiporter n=1 Tax=Tessaracoccus flavus TaxID=1610493 RepID=A0A1Q2CJ30_9ACTN|nr:cation:proton antiporter [Tessaracoccus flavus]AQP46121.1 sodium:proton antiporter [Tessaracoccus flavus]SDY55347.1 sodium/proton antiporter, CPA1 family [Tessaracoccus flavus]
MWTWLTEFLAGLGPAPYLALVAVVAGLSQWLAWQVRVPSILLLLLVGFGLGQLVSPDAVLGRDVLFGGVTLAVGVILFEGALTLHLRDVRGIGRPVLRLCSVTVVIAWALISAAAWLIGFDLSVALLVGAILVVTGPTVIAPILRTLRPTRRVAALLKWEGIIVDPIGAVLAVLVFQGVLLGRGGEGVPQLIGNLLLTVVIATALGAGMGWILEQLMKRHAIPDFLQGVACLTSAIGVLVVSNALQSESGLLAVTVLGLYLGNRGLHLRPVEEFTEHLQVLFVGALFVILAGRISPADLVAVAPRAFLFVALLVIVVRPVSIWLGLWGTRVTREERGLLAFMAPRGIVAAAVTSIFGIEFHHAVQRMRERAAEATGDEALELTRRADNLAVLAAQTTELVPLVFLVIVLTVALYGLGVGRLAERLGLATTSPQGILFVGAQSWVVQAASALEKAGITTLIVSREYSRLSGARKVGLTTVTANILSDYAVRDMDLAGIKSLIAATKTDEVNATAAREFAHVLGRANVYQLARRTATVSAGKVRTEAASHLTARTCFDPSLNFDELEELVGRGHQVRSTRLTADFTYADLQARGDDSVMLFVVADGQVTIVDEDTQVPDKGVTAIYLAPPRDHTDRAVSRADS